MGISLCLDPCFNGFPWTKSPGFIKGAALQDSKLIRLEASSDISLETKSPPGA